MHSTIISAWVRSLFFDHILITFLDGMLFLPFMEDIRWIS